MKLFCTHFQEPDNIIGGKNIRIVTLSLRHLSNKLKYSIFAVHSEFAFGNTSVHIDYLLFTFKFTYYLIIYNKLIYWR